MTLDATPIFLIGFLLVLGLLVGSFAGNRLRFPRVVGYIFLGILCSPPLLGRYLGVQSMAWTEPLVTVALAMIAYLIGGSMSVEQLRRLGGQIIGTTLGESLGAVLLVTVAVWLLAEPPAGVPAWQLALGFGALAAATAPAATVAILHQYRARGEMTTTLLGVVAMDDAFAVILFSVLLAALTNGSLVGSFLQAIWETGGAVLLGAATGLLMTRMGRVLREAGQSLALVLGCILLLTALAEILHVSALLASIALGFMARHLGGPHGARLLQPVEELEEVVFVLFFAFAGMHFDPAVFAAYAGLILIYFIARALGKLIGAQAGARLAGASPPVARWLGLGLLPQGGVAIGLALLLAHAPGFEAVGVVLVNVIVATTLLNESLGAISVRFALARVGELGKKRERSHHESH